MKSASKALADVALATAVRFLNDNLEPWKFSGYEPIVEELAAVLVRFATADDPADLSECARPRPAISEMNTGVTLVFRRL